ncbi:MAG: pilin [Candidatus Paceibacterota bacterium]
MKKSLAFIFLFVSFLAVPTALIFAQSTSSTSTWSLLGPKEGQGGCMEIELPYIPRCGATPASYLSGLYRLALVLGVLAALIMIVIAGITYATSGDNASKQKEARGQIKDAIIGLVILFASVLILNTINPALVSMSLPNIPSPELSPSPSPTKGLTKVDECISSCMSNICRNNFGVFIGHGDHDIPDEKDERRPKYDMCVRACRSYCQSKFGGQ